jgi:hypothetical protein
MVAKECPKLHFFLYSFVNWKINKISDCSISSFKRKYRINCVIVEFTQCHVEEYISLSCLETSLKYQDEKKKTENQVFQ